MSGHNNSKRSDHVVRNLRALFAGLLLCGASSVAWAVPIVSFSSSTASVAVGEDFTVDVTVGELDNQLIGAYDLTLSWNSLLSLTNVEFDVFLDGPADSISGFDVGAGSVNVFEVSLGLLSNQTGVGAFRLFSLTFEALTAGTGTVMPPFGAIQILSNELGEPYKMVLEKGLSIKITPPVAVPEPGSFMLSAVGLIAMAGVAGGRRRFRGYPTGR